MKFCHEKNIVPHMYNKQYTKFQVIFWREKNEHKKHNKICTQNEHKRNTHTHTHTHIYEQEHLDGWARRLTPYIHTYMHACIWHTQNCIKELLV